MKYIIAGQAVLLIVMAVFLFIKTGDTSEADLKEKAAKAIIAHLNGQLDSLSERVRITDEALEKADAIILGYKAEVIRAHSQTQKWKQQYDSLNFQPFASDSARHRALRNLYPNEGF